MGRGGEHLCAGLVDPAVRSDGVGAEEQQVGVAEGDAECSIGEEIHCDAGRREGRGEPLSFERGPALAAADA